MHEAGSGESVPLCSFVLASLWARKKTREISNATGRLRMRARLENKNTEGSNTEDRFHSVFIK